jgi:hypothetical protein
MDYLKQNELEENIDQFSLEDLMEPGEGELSHAYDTMLSAFDGRERLIE